MANAKVGELGKRWCLSATDQVGQQETGRKLPGCQIWAGRVGWWLARPGPGGGKDSSGGRACVIRLDGFFFQRGRWWFWACGTWSMDVWNNLCCLARWMHHIITSIKSTICRARQVRSRKQPTSVHANQVVAFFFLSVWSCWKVAGLLSADFDRLQNKDGPPRAEEWADGRVAALFQALQGSSGKFRHTGHLLVVPRCSHAPLGLHRLGTVSGLQITRPCPLTSRRREHPEKPPTAATAATVCLGQATMLRQVPGMSTAKVLPVHSPATQCCLLHTHPAHG